LKVRRIPTPRKGGKKVLAAFKKGKELNNASKGKSSPVGGDTQRTKRGPGEWAQELPLWGGGDTGKKRPLKKKTRFPP